MTLNAPKTDNSPTSRVIFGIACAFIIAIYTWSAESGHLELASPHAEDTYYNLLVQGFRSGQLNVKKDAPPGLATLADPYDPKSNSSYVWDAKTYCYEMSYYKGKLYLYFGVTPAVVLFWPYAVLTGHYLLHKDAVVIFFSVGFLAAAWLLYAIWRRYLPGVSVWTMVAGVFALGLATCALQPLSHCDVYEVPHSCGFTFSMLTLLGIWNALHSGKRAALWLALASMTYGLAVGARPSLLFGAVILLIPVVHAWRTENSPISIARLVWLLCAAIIPITLIGIGLMAYNYLRFDNPFEFGWHYMLTDVRNGAAQQFSPHYFWFNLWFYLFEPVRWGGNFPFLRTDITSSAPSHYYGLGEPYAGLLINYPIVWLAFAAALTWKSSSKSQESSPLRWFIWATFLLFATCALTLCLFFSGSSGYLPDFLPALILLAAIGVLAVEWIFRNGPARRRIVRCAWFALLAYTVLFNVLASVKTHAACHYFNGNSFFHQKLPDEAIEQYKKALALEPKLAAFHIGLGNAYAMKGMLDDAIAQHQTAVDIEPTNAEAHYNLGLGLIEARRTGEAAVHLKKTVELDPSLFDKQEAAVNNNVAWSLATDPDPAYRNGTFAVMFAEAACKKTHYQDTMMVGTLAAAYAETGRFDDAIATAEKACVLASQSGDQQLLQKNKELLALYRKHQPYHENEGNNGN